MTSPAHSVDLEKAHAPEGMRLYAIGDIHGCLDQLDEMHRLIAEEIARDKPEDWRIIHLGDFIDRGPDSRGVLSRLVAARARDPRNIVLLGNHDAGLLDFLAIPTPHSLFARYGGDATSASYGVELRVEDDVALRRTHSALRRAIPRSQLEMLETAATSVSFGDFFFCHAGIKPGVPLEHQRRDELIWIRDEFLEDTHLHPKVVVHGHTPVEQPEFRRNRVNIDTGCYRTGMLTGLVIDQANKRILTAKGER